MTASPDLAIRLRRAAFNRALAQGDLAAIGPILAPKAVLVTGTDSAVLPDRKAQLTAWKREFGAAQRIIYTRMTERVVASRVEPVAMEYGTWTGVSAQSTLAAGDYSAKWREVGGQWVIEAEIFVTME